jgi:hypothetical protein
MVGLGIDAGQVAGIWIAVRVAIGYVKEVDKVVSLLWVCVIHRWFPPVVEGHCAAPID